MSNAAAAPSATTWSATPPAAGLPPDAPPDAAPDTPPDAPPDARARPPLAQGPLQVVMNGAAGNHDDEAVLQALQQVLGAAGRPFRLHRAPQPAALAATARAALDRAGDDGVVVAVGGDGTINTVAAALLGHRVTLGLVPRGTFNYVARAHGIPLQPDAAVQLLLTGRPRAVQAGLLNERPFLVNASLGLYPELLQDREAFKQRFGRTRLVALGSALRTLLRAHPRLQLRVQADGQPARTLHVSTLFVGNNPLQLQAVGLPEAGLAGHRALVALALRAFRPGELLWLALRGALGRLGEAQDLSHFAFSELWVQPRLPLPQRRLKVALDGEVIRLQPPLRFAVDPRPLWLISPTTPPTPDGAMANDDPPGMQAPPPGQPGAGA